MTDGFINMNYYYILLYIILHIYVLYPEYIIINTNIYIFSSLSFCSYGQPWIKFFGKFVVFLIVFIGVSHTPAETVGLFVLSGFCSLSDTLNARVLHINIFSDGLGKFINFHTQKMILLTNDIRSLLKPSLFPKF